MRWQKPKDKTELIALALRVASVVLIAAILLEVITAFAGAAQARKTIKQAVALAANDPNNLQAHLAKQNESADALKQKNLFMPTPKPSPPTVAGILGDAAFINGKWCKAGESAGDVKIIAIGATEVQVEWQGKEMTLAPIKTPGSGPSGPPQRPPPTKMRPGHQPASPQPTASSRKAEAKEPQPSRRGRRRNRRPNRNRRPHR